MNPDGLLTDMIADMQKRPVWQNSRFPDPVHHFFSEKFRKVFVKPKFSANNDLFTQIVNKLLTIITIPRREYTRYIVPESEICKCENQNLFKFIFHFF